MHEYELSIDIGGHRLSGTVCLPASTGRYPIVLMLHGSGPLDRNENMPGQRLESELTRLPGLQGKLLRLYTRLLGSPVASQRKLIARIRASTTPTLRIGLRTYEAAWLRELLQLDLSPLLAAVRCPMLVVAAAKDIQCDPEDARRIAADNPLAEAHVIEDLTHILRRDTRPASLFGYQQLLAQPVDKQLLELVAGWLEQRRAVLEPCDELS